MGKKLGYRAIMVAACLLLCRSAVAAPASEGQVTGLLPLSSGTEEVFFVSIQTINQTPACNSTSRFTMKSSNPRYKATLAALLAAYSSGSEVRVFGLGTCNNWANSEDISHVCFGAIFC